MSNDDKLIIPDPDDAEDGEVARTRHDERTVDWEYIYDLRQVVEELESTDGIVDVECHIADPVPTFTIETLEHGLGFDIPRRIKQLYVVADGFHLEWSLECEGERIPGGGIELFDFATVFDSWIDELWPADTSPEEEAFLWSLRGVARFPDPERDEMVVLCVEEEYPTYDLFLHHPKRQTSQLLTVGFQRYLELLLETKGTYGWHHLVAEDGVQNDRQRERVRHFEDVMTHHFPDTDLDRELHTAVPESDGEDGRASSLSESDEPSTPPSDDTSET